MPRHDIIVVGASAGGVELLCQLVSDLPQDIPASICIVLHVPAQSTSVLPGILNRAIAKKHKTATTRLWASHPQGTEALERGKIYVAPPDRHLLIKDGSVHVAMGPKENSHRPAIDTLFRSAARAYGQRVVGVVLSGLLDDGTAGLAAIKQRGGVAIAQDPEEALYSGMPQSAIDNVDVDRILPIAGIVDFLSELAYLPVSELAAPVSQQMQIETDIMDMDIAAIENNDRPGNPSGYACPECRGVLWEIREGKITRFRCRTGHSFSINSLLAEQSQALEVALWSALRALEEKAALTQRMSEQAIARNQALSAKRFSEQAQEAYNGAALVRDLLLNQNNQSLSVRNGELTGQNLESSLGSDRRTLDNDINGKKG
ncbi:chemotaxis protein CheB [Aliterella atlantica]|uniref:chemotaxis protein CheB n=1 Tax=Aliterella atlantica TaxID=1827278 RepID=UPI0005D459CB|nr:chemotaxis protein CheB [Aliterella atlantica]